MLTDDHPAILFGPKIEDKHQDGEVPSFYVRLNVYDVILHNAMLDLGASHNLMSKVIMERLGIDVTRPYKDLYSFDSSRVKCLGLIKDLTVSLTQIPSKSMVMDIVVADIPPMFGMLLPRSWIEKMQGVVQTNMSYITVSVFGGQTRRLYQEPLMSYMITSKEKPTNHPVYAVHFYLDSFILFNSECPKEDKKCPIVISEIEEMENKKHDSETNDEEGKELNTKVDEE